MSVGPGQREVLGQNIREYERVHWPDDGGTRVETVVDPNWLIDGKPRVVRRIGWRNCMCCKRRMFSPDITRVRICNLCKDITIDLSYDRMRNRLPAKRARRRRRATTRIDLTRPAESRTLRELSPVAVVPHDRPTLIDRVQSQGQS